MSKPDKFRPDKDLRNDIDDAVTQLKSDGWSETTQKQARVFLTHHVLPQIAWRSDYPANIIFVKHERIRLLKEVPIHNLQSGNTWWTVYIYKNEADIGSLTRIATIAFDSRELWEAGYESGVYQHDQELWKTVATLVAASSSRVRPRQAEKHEETSGTRVLSNEAPEYDQKGKTLCLLWYNGQTYKYPEDDPEITSTKERIMQLDWARQEEDYTAAFDRAEEQCDDILARSHAATDDRIKFHLLVSNRENKQASAAELDYLSREYDDIQFNKDSLANHPRLFSSEEKDAFECQKKRRIDRVRDLLEELPAGVSNRSAYAAEDEDETAAPLTARSPVARPAAP
ncbi:hypothetical protein PG994_009967 [Apiospora phragmitis]|uniref:Uncharacterized protein n=1 Tax=Apiospora phragmitis TaxID=2905665 RepID=A0ABR1TNS6_9PEZI